MEKNKVRMTSSEERESRYMMEENASANIGGQTRAHFFKSVHKSAKCAVGRINAHYF